MRHFPRKFPSARVLAAVALVQALWVGGLNTPAFAASVSLATAPLTTSTTTSVKPNLLFVLDDSGSMAWDHLPDDASDGGSAVSFVFGYYGLRSSQCNQVYYDPAITYKPPVTAANVDYSDATFTGAKDNGFDTSGSPSTTNLNTSFRASSSLSGDGSDQVAYYYAYSGSQTSKPYHNAASTFVTECGYADKSDAGEALFTRIVLGSGVASTTAKLTLNCSSCTNTSVSSIKINGVEAMTGSSTASNNTTTAATNIAAKIAANGFSATASGNVVTITGVPDTANKIVVTKASGNMSFSPAVHRKTDSAQLTNFANWYSYYRTRILMMKTAAGRAFSALDGSYRVGLQKINTGNPTVGVDAFESTHRSNWYTALYATSPSGSTPLRTALSTAGRYYAGKLSGVTDPIQYSCQQNFTILSTDGYWNTGDGYQMDGSTVMGNADGQASRPMYDGSVVAGTSTITLQYTRDSYTCGGCTSSTNQLRRQPQIGSCSVSVSGTPTGTESCTPGSWSNNGARVDGACVSNTACTASIPSPNPTNLAEYSRVVTTDTSGGSSNSLADVAMYYYENDLRTGTGGSTACTSGATGEDVCTNNVFTSATDNNNKQHMTTFTLGLGVSGKMLYSPTYLADTSGDYFAVSKGSTASATVCTWQAAGTACSWPVPGITSGNGWIENIDDLWHAAVNGRGAYFAATNPTSLAAGLSNALAGLNTRKGSAAAAATSTLNPVAGNNFAYVASYTTVSWRGNLEARGINTETGVVNVNATWCVEDVPAGVCNAPSSVVSINDGDITTWYCKTPDSTVCTGGVLDGTDCFVRVATSCTGTLKTRVTDTTDTRTIYTSDGNGASPVLTPFDSSYASAKPTYFAKAHISGLSQWSSLTTTQQDAAEGANLINFLRGRYGYEDRTSNVLANRLYRFREAIMGDALESQPAFLAAPLFSYPYPGYLSYKTAQAGRAGSVFMGTNDGMMHSFDAASGAERWAYVPTMVIPNMWKLADKNYAALHTNYVNGSPVTSDICVSNCDNDASAVWKTILVAGLNGGGRGYYALDITVPGTPVLLWEMTTTSGVGNVKDDDLGYSFGPPIITRKQDGTWVVIVTSGYNNTSPGTGKGFLYVLNAKTGQIISKIATGVGDTTTPSGLAKVSAWNIESTGNTTGYVYGGDLLGNVWRFNINDSGTAAAIGTGSAMKFAELFSDTGGTSRQPITTAPTLATAAGKRIIIVSTGKYLEVSDLTTTQVQSIYAIKDDDAASTFSNPRTNTTLMKKQTMIPNTDGTDSRIISSPKTVDFTQHRGWFIDLPDVGERVNIDAKLVQGVLLVASTVPASTACSPGGYGWLNFLDYEKGTAINNLVSTKYQSPIVGVNVLYIQGQPIVEVVTSTDPTPEKDPAPEFKGNAPTFQAKRVSWRELIP